MRLLSVRLGATVLLLVVTLLIARASLSNLHTPAAEPRPTRRAS